MIVVGASGRVGGTVSPIWQSDQVLAGRIVLQSRSSDAVTDAASLKWDPMDGPDELCDWVGQYGKLQAMIVLAGVTPGQGKDLSLNTDIAVACVTAAAAARIPRVLIASSSAVYGAGDGTAFRETSACQPANAYGEAKLAMEHACHEHAKADLDVCCLRIGNVAGADALLLNVAELGPDEPVVIDTFADGRGPVRSYIGPKSLARVLAELAEHDAVLPPALNVAAPAPISMDALAEAAGQPWTARPTHSAAQQSITLDTTLLNEFCSFSREESCPSQMVSQWKETFL
jgi:nucleoside-diphosphate-sugar epimerase